MLNRMSWVVVFLAWSGGALGEEVRWLGLEEAIGLALERNRDLAVVGRGVDRAELGVEAAASEFGLQWSPDGNAGVAKGGDSWQYGLRVARPTRWGTEVSGGGRFRSEGRDEEEGRREFTAWDVRVAQPLFRRAGRLVNEEGVMQARQGVRAALRQVEAAKAGLVIEVVETFERIRVLEEQIEGDVRALERARRLAALTEARERQGRASAVDVLRVDLLRGEAEARLASSRERLDVGRRSLAELVGARPDVVFRLEEPVRLALELPGTEEAVRLALANRLDYGQRFDGIEDARRGERIARRELWPDVSVVGQVSWLSGDVEEEDWFVGLTTGAGYSARRQRNEVARSRLEVVDAVDQMENLALVIARQVQQQMTAYGSAQVEAEIEERNFVVAMRREELARRMFEAGRGDHGSVTDAEDQLTQASIRRLNARARASVSGYRLLWVMGLLIDSPAELKAPLDAAERGRDVVWRAEGAGAR